MAEIHPVHWSEIKTRVDLCVLLQCSIQALDYVRIPDNSKLCKGVKGGQTCPGPYPVAGGNYGKCVFCKRSWHPLDSLDNPQCAQRGFLLLGTEFTYGATSNKHTCCCNNKVCRGIGYTDSMFSFPSNDEYLNQWLHAIGNQNINKVKSEAIKKCPGNYRLAWWHFDPDHLEPSTDGRWTVKLADQYIDKDGKIWQLKNHPPPNFAPVKAVEFIQQQRMLTRQEERIATNDLPDWVKTMASVVGERRLSRPLEETSGNVLKRKIFLETENWALKRQLTEERGRRERAEAMLAAVKDDNRAQVESLNARIKSQANQVSQLFIEVDTLRKSQAEVNIVVNFDSLRQGKLLGKYVKDFTPFWSFAANEKFLDLINYRPPGGKEGSGLCENLIRYSSVTMAQRRQVQESLNDSQSTVPSFTGIRYLHCTDYKTQWLVFCMYLFGGLTENQVQALTQLSAGSVCDIIYAWANLLCTILSKWFPVPTRKQMLQRYPIQVYLKFGHALIFDNEDASEFPCQDPHSKNAHGIVFSAYKHRPMLKLLTACDGIGTTWDGALSPFYGGAISDTAQTASTHFLDTVPFGMMRCVDKGIPVSNEASERGVGMQIPQQKMTRQVQQNEKDTANTQKTGNTWIVNEQLHGGTKRSSRYLQHELPLLQLPLVSLLVKVSFLLQNLRPGYVQGRARESEEGRPCHAEVRYYGADEDGLFDARPHIDLWACKTEKAKWHELRRQHPEKSNTEISDMVLDLDIPSQLRAELEKL